MCHLDPPRNIVYQEPRPAMPLLGQPAGIEVKIRSVYSLVGPDDWCSRFSLKVVEPRVNVPANDPTESPALLEGHLADLGPGEEEIS
jgi:hypothetical protein